MSVSPYLRGLLDELVDEDTLRMEGYEHTGGMCAVKCQYCLPERYRDMSPSQASTGRVF